MNIDVLLNDMDRVFCCIDPQKMFICLYLWLIRSD